MGDKSPKAKDKARKQDASEKGRQKAAAQAKQQPAPSPRADEGKKK